MALPRCGLGRSYAGRAPWQRPSRQNARHAMARWRRRTLGYTRRNPARFSDRAALVARQPKIAFAAATQASPRRPRRGSRRAIPMSPRTQADIIVALGGDGLMLETLHRTIDRAGAADLRHEPRHRRLPDERVRRGRSARGAWPPRPASALHPLRMEARTIDGTLHQGARDQRGVAAARDAPDRQDPHPHRRRRAPARAGLRRRAGRHAGRQHRLQPVGARADPAARRGPAGADADQRLPAAALARRAAAARRPRSSSTCSRPTSGRSARSPTSPRSATSREVTVREDDAVSLTLLFDPEHNLEERILKEQFVP